MIMEVNNVDKNLIKKHGLLLSLLVTFLIIFALFGANLIYKSLYFITTEKASILCNIFIRAVYSVLILLLAYKLCLTKKIYFRPFHIWKSVKAGWFLWGVIILRYIATIITLQSEANHKVIWSRIGLFLLLILLVGIFEELSFRGVVYSALKIHFSKNTNLLLVIILQGIFFGLLHIVNWFMGSVGVIYCIFQIITAIAMGIYLATVYEKSRSMLGVILLHSFFDGSNLVIYLYGYDIKLDNGSLSWPSIIIALFLLIVSIFYAKRVTKGMTLTAES